MSTNSAVCAEDQRVKVEEEIVVETEKTAVGNGTGLIITATTTTGCIFGGSALGERVTLLHPFMFVSS